MGHGLRLRLAAGKENRPDRVWQVRFPVGRVNDDLIVIACGLPARLSSALARCLVLLQHELQLLTPSKMTPNAAAATDVAASASGSRAAISSTHCAPIMRHHAPHSIWPNHFGRNYEATLRRSRGVGFVLVEVVRDA